ncbi:hypothetical protein V1499_05900 [Neobacillus sp. SCS-31]|uniref:hypothetical protein n=1 Tax=Neobacillus oceani TaxID=3115292 RepID=UPI0039059454
MNKKKIQIIGVILVVCLAIAGLNFIPDNEKAVKAKKQPIDRRVSNIEIFGKLYGYVRYFHPSDEAAELDWNRFGTYGVEKVKDAANEKELKAVLDELFFPIAPTLSLYTKDEKPPKKPKIKKTDKVIAWQHYGPPGHDTSLFQSKRIQAIRTGGSLSLNDGMLFANFPKENERYKGLLGKSIRFDLPLTLYVENNKTIGSTQKSRDRFEGLKKNLQEMDPSLSTDNENVRFAGVLSAWNMLAHFHPSSQFSKSKLNGQLAASLKDAADDKNRDNYLKTLYSLMEVTNDGIAAFSFLEFSKTYKRQPFAFDFVENKFVVTAVPSSTKLRPGDEIVTINGVDAKTYIDSIAENIPGSPQFKLWMAIDSVLDDENAKIVFSQGGHQEEGRFSENDFRYVDEFNRTDFFKLLEDGVYYINPSLNIQGLNEILFVKKEELRQAKAIIFDMRGNNLDYGIFSSIIELQGDKSGKWPIEKVMQVVHPYHKNATFEDLFQPERVIEESVFKGKAVFLSYGGTVGRPEYFLNYVKDRGLGTIVGQVSAGAFGYYQDYRITMNLRGLMAGTDTFSGDGMPNFSVGVQPDIPVTRTLEGVRNGVDEYVEKAIEVINNP